MTRPRTWIVSLFLAGCAGGASSASGEQILDLSWAVEDPSMKIVEERHERTYAMGLEDVSRLRFTFTTVEEEFLGTPEFTRFTGEVDFSGGWQVSAEVAGHILNVGTADSPRYELPVLLTRQRSRACSHESESEILRFGTDGSMK